jgi:hypothetical protein
MVKLYKKLQGTALDLFSSLNSQQYRNDKVIGKKIPSLDDGAVQSIMASMQT